MILGPFAPAGRFEFRVGDEIASLVDGVAYTGPIDDPDVVVEGDAEGLYYLFVERRLDDGHRVAEPRSGLRARQRGRRAGTPTRGHEGGGVGGGLGGEEIHGSHGGEVLGGLVGGLVGGGPRARR